MTGLRLLGPSSPSVSGLSPSSPPPRCAPRTPPSRPAAAGSRRSGASGTASRSSSSGSRARCTTSTTSSSNLERQRESTQRIVNEIERQIGGLASQLDRSSAELILAEDNLAERRAVLERRLVDIYKRGPALHLPGAARRRVVRRPAQPLQVPLPHQPAGPRPGDRRRAAPEPGRHRAQHHPRRAHPARPLPAGARGGVRQVHRPGQRPRAAAARRCSARPGAPSGGSPPCRRTRPGSTACSPRSSAPGGTRPRAAASAARVAGPGSITTASLGKLDWPVEGTIVYRFGRDTLPSGGIIRWNGVGIAAPVGTPVHAVEAGKVRLVGQFGTYGLTVVLEHGNGYYSVYSHLQSAAVKLGDGHHQGGDDRRRRRARTPTTGRTCISRSGARTRWRSTPRPGSGSASPQRLLGDADPLAALGLPATERGLAPAQGGRRAP